jgi:ribonuclease Z
MRVIFLGTGAGIPTASRALPAIAILRKGELLLFDVGEGTQRQMVLSKIGFCKRTKIFITHMHGDHIFGLHGLIQTMSLLGRKKPLYIYGPIGISKFVNSIKKNGQFGLSYEIKIFEVDEGIVCQNNEYKVIACSSDHSTKNLAYGLIENDRPGKFYPEKAVSLNVPEGPLWSRLQSGKEVILVDKSIVTPRQVIGEPRPGRKIVYTGDTKPSDKIINLAYNADLLIHESTVDDEFKEKAEDAGHSTASQAALIAKKARVKKLILTHISARYKDVKIMMRQAKKIFPNVVIAKDLMEIEIPYS